MSDQLNLSVLPVADPAWAERVEAERRAEEQQREREDLVRAVRELCERSDFFGLVSTATVLEQVEGYPPLVDESEAPEAFRRMAARLRDLAKRGMLERFPGDYQQGRRAPGLWGLPIR